MSNLVPYSEKQQLAESLVRSGLFGLKDAHQAIGLMALCEADGLHPVSAIREFHIVQGRPAMKADAMLARLQRAGGAVKWVHYTDEKVVGEFSHPQGGAVTIEWTIERAKRIGLASKDNWRNYPRNMLRARCISEGVKAVFPGVATGIYTVEEVQDMTPAQQQAALESDTVTVPAIESGRAQEIRAAFEACATADDLAKAWAGLSKDERKAMASAKDDAKARITGAA